MKIIEAKIIDSCEQCDNETCIIRNEDMDYSVPYNCPLKDAPEWLSKPDSEGWWWFRHNNGTYHSYLWSESDLDGRYDEWFKCNFAGKWQKAIVPEER